MSQWTWEHMPDDFEFNTWKMKVPGGWLIRTVESNSWDNHTSSAMVFIPEVKE